MMLSAGNLNTAALSLFLALHLAVSLNRPSHAWCSTTRFRRWMRFTFPSSQVSSWVLAKHHKRQVVIAVHQRELFEQLVARALTCVRRR